MKYWTVTQILKIQIYMQVNVYVIIKVIVFETSSSNMRLTSAQLLVRGKYLKFFFFSFSSSSSSFIFLLLFFFTSKDYAYYA